MCLKGGAPSHGVKNLDAFKGGSNSKGYTKYRVYRYSFGNQIAVCTFLLEYLHLSQF